MNKEKIGMLKEKYRRGVGMMIINKNQEIFIGQRFEKDKSAWQMPQGGIDKGEKTVDAVKREMHEETGINKNFEILYETKTWHYYKLPVYLQKKFHSIMKISMFFQKRFHPIDSLLTVAMAPRYESSSVQSIVF